MRITRFLRGLTRLHWLALACAPLLFALACRIGGDDELTLQGWYEERGPVVPHDSFPGDCSTCHTGDDWHTIRSDFAFDHERETGVKLEGAHTQAQCLRCHNDRGPVALFAARGCAGCHENVHRGQLGDDCSACHTQQNWRPNEAIVAHSRTRFPLMGAHAAVACWRCHPGAQTGNFARADTDCAVCHQDDVARTASPNHAAQGWTSDCQRCHIPTQWSSGFTHSFWPLTGRHKQTQCVQCHPGGVFDTASPQCVSCHQGDYDGTANPPHSQAGFSTACQQCHSTNGWTPASYAHTSWPLTGRHKTTACMQCHGSGVYAGLPSQCVDCHLADYQGTTDPDHQLYNFPTTCQQCHTTSSWDANFNHTGVTTGCGNCHQDDYNATTNPNHAAAGFSTTCEQCHTSTTTWNQAPGYTHPDFPINGGPHGGFSCNQCHTTPGNYSAFSCTHCHEHRQSEMADKHQNVPNYQWLSSACYQCHPTGQE